MTIIVLEIFMTFFNQLSTFPKKIICSTWSMRTMQHEVAGSLGIIFHQKESPLKCPTTTLPKSSLTAKLLAKINRVPQKTM